MKKEKRERNKQELIKERREKGKMGKKWKRGDVRTGKERTFLCLSGKRGTKE